MRSAPDTPLPVVAPAAGADLAVSSRALLLISGILYPAWWLVIAAAGERHATGALLVERIAVGGLCLVLFAATFHARGVQRAAALTLVALYAITVHHFSVVARTGTTLVRTITTSIILGSSVVVCFTVRQVITYSLFVIATAALTTAVARRVPGSSEFFFPGVVTVQVMLAAATWRSIAVREAMGRAVDDARRFLGLVIDAVPDPIFVEDRDGRWALVNQAFARMVGKRRDMLVGSRAADTAPSGLVRALSCEDQNLSDGHWVEREQSLPGAAGEPQTFATKMARSRTSGGDALLVGVMRDITERKALECSLARKVDELQSARTRVRQLEGLLPICMHCHKIRKEDGDWQAIENYVQAHSDAVFTHAVCRSCLERHHPA